jgi:hypothetical protein
MDDDPHPPRHRITQEIDPDVGYGLLTALALLIVAGAIVFTLSKNDAIQTADTNRPAATQPASQPAHPPSTTGSGSTTDSR